MPGTVTKTITTDPTDLLNGLADGDYWVETRPNDSLVILLLTTSATAPDARQIEESAAFHTIRPAIPREIAAAPGSHSWAWTRPGNGKALLAISPR